MKRTPARWIENSIVSAAKFPLRFFRHFSLFFAFSLLLVLIPRANAQWENFASEHGDLAKLLQNVNASRALLYEALEAMGSAADTAPVRNNLQRQLDREANMAMDDMMAQGHNMATMAMTDTGPFDQIESPVQMDILAFIGSTDTADYMARIEQAVENIDAVNQRILNTLDHGTHFRTKIYEIYADDSIRNKQQAVAEAVSWYAQLNGYSVPSVPKNADLVLSHRHANAFARAYPKLSALNWSSRWIELATIETLMLEYRDNQLTDAVDKAAERFWAKVNVEDHMSSTSTVSPAPSERPTAPAIAPQLYNAHPEVAIILDNLSMFETMLLDILAYPNLTNRQNLIAAAADEFTNKETNLSENLDYIVSALRGGIYDQGGPASGELTQSERNRSRGNMEMEHNTPKPSSTMRID